MEYTIYPFPQGELFIAGSSQGLSIVKYRKNAEEVDEFIQYLKKLSLSLRRHDDRFLREKKLFDRYFQGEKENFISIDIDVASATPYQRAVWTVSRKISYGRTEAYKWIAHQLQHTGYRSVGQALNKNPLLIIVPCHRVISADGNLGGFGAGLKLKRYLLDLEKMGLNP